MVNWLRNSKVLTFSHFVRVFWGTLGWDVSIEGKLTNHKVLTHKLTNKETRHRWNTLTDNWGRSHSRGWNASSQPSSWNAKPVPNSCSKALVDRPRGKQSLETINLNIFWLSALYCHGCPRDWENTVRPIGILFGHQLSASCYWLCVRSQASCYLTEVATSGGGRLSQG